MVLLLPLLALAGCGNSRAPVPGLSAAATPSGVRTLNFPKAGIRFQAPRNWTLVSGPAPMVTTVT